MRLFVQLGRNTQALISMQQEAQLMQDVRREHDESKQLVIESRFHEDSLVRHFDQ